MKINQINSKSIFYLFLVLITFTSCSCKRINTIEDVEATIGIGNELVNNIEKYKSKYNKYPEKLEDLVPEFYDKVPKTKMKEYNNYNDKKIVYRNYKYINNKELVFLVFNGDLEARICNALARDTCSNIFFYYLNSNNLIVQLQNEKENYKNWRYYVYNTCQPNENPLECKFKKQLKCKYIEAQVNEE